MEIVDNFLQPDDFDTIASTIMSKGFPWYHQDDVAYKDEGYNGLSSLYIKCVL